MVNETDRSDLDEAPPLEDEPSDGRRTNSAIQFPYSDLNDAVETARAIHRNVGTGFATWEQIAEWLGHQSATSGGFRIKMATARQFGLSTNRTGGATLTTLGVQIADPTRERAARANAFLSVPLFRAVFDRYQGLTLPADSGLEREIVSLGVSPKQKERARQILQRSADQAGFFHYGRNKLVWPLTDLSSDGRTPPLVSGGPISRSQEVHPLIAGLLQTLPEPGTAWPLDRREHWLKTAEHILELIYGEAPESRGGD